MGYIGQSPQIAQSTYQSIDDISSSFDGSTTSFALQVGGVSPVPFPIASENCLISVGGVIQEPDGTGTNGFQLTGTNIVFSAAPASGQSFFGVILAGADYVTAGTAFPDGDAGTPSITFNQDLDTGLFRGGTGITSVSSNNNKIADFGPTAIVFNEDGDNVDFRVEGDTKANLFVVDAGNDKITLDGDLEPTTINGITFPTAGTLSNRNLIINGAMQVAVRGDVTGANSVQYGGPDRFRTILQAGAYTLSQSTNAPEGFSNSYLIDCTTSATPSGTNAVLIQQRIEAQNLQHLKFGTANAEELILSFYVRSTVAGVITVEAYIDDDGRQISREVTISSADTWEYKTVSIPGDTTGVIDNNNGPGMDITFWLAAGPDYKSGTLNTSGWAPLANANRVSSSNINFAGDTANNFRITGIQLELGSKATPFEHRSIGDELARCQRYFIAIHDPRLRGVVNTAGSLNRCGLTLPTTMRQDPTYTTTGTYDVYDGSSIGTLTSFTASYTTKDSVEFDGTPATGSFTHQAPAIFYVHTSTNQLNVDAEL